MIGTALLSSPRRRTRNTEVRSTHATPRCGYGSRLRGTTPRLRTDDDMPSLHLRRDAHADRPLRRRARQGARRRSRRRADQGADGSAIPRSTGRRSTRSYLGCANQAGEDNRNVARMALLLAGLPDTIPGVTVNRLCASGLNAVGAAAQAIRAGEIDFAIAGGVESMTRAPFVMGKAGEAFSRTAEIHDTTIGWRFVNPLMKQQYGVDAMPETAENVAEEYPDRAQGPGRLRAALAAARRQGDGVGLLRGRDRAGRGAGRHGRPGHGRQGRASAPRHDARRRSPSSSRSCAIPAPSRPAMRRASTTAPPR